MKGIATIALVAAVAAGVSASPHSHGHRHLHAKKHAHGHSHAEVEKRDGTVIVTEVVEGPTVVVYQLDGETIAEEEAKKGIEKGLYMVMGSSHPSFVPPPPAVTTSIAKNPKGGQFFEQKITTSSTSTSAPPPPKKTKAPPKPKPKPAAPSPPLGGNGLDREFPSGKVKCGPVPTDYGAIEIPWEGIGGWTTLMKIGKYIKGVKVNNIEQPISGTCAPGMMCSYACPPGYQKTQWPDDAQGATGQSVGGLWCNEDGFLELTRPEHPTLCEPGAGGVFVENRLPENAAVCRTDYPGNEAMTIPIDTQPGGTYPLTNPVSSKYYVWEGKPTTAQYYVNDMGVSVKEACTWKSKLFPDRAGNWAPTNIGVGKDDSGITYISIFPNLPTSNAVLDFDIEITGDISGECWLKSGTYAKENGCTVGLQEGGKATIVFKPSV